MPCCRAHNRRLLSRFRPDLNRLFAIGKEVKEIAGSVEGTVDVNIEQQTERPQLLIRPRRDVLAARGVRMGDFANAIETALGGRVVSQVYSDGYAYDVAVILDEEHRGTLDDIAALTVDSPSGKISLGELADIKSTSGPILSTARM